MGGKYFSFELYLFVPELMSWKLAGCMPLGEERTPLGCISINCLRDIFNRRLVSREKM